MSAILNIFKKCNFLIIASNLILLILLTINSYADNITQIEPITFGHIQASHNSDNTIIINPINNSISSHHLSLNNNFSRGKYIVQCNNPGIAIIDIQNNNSDSEIETSNYTGFYNGYFINSFPTKIDISSSIGQNLYIGCTLKYKNNSAKQDYQLVFNLHLTCPPHLGE